MPVPITGLYAALLALVGLTLMVRVARMRARTGVSILHGWVQGAKLLLGAVVVG